MTVTYVRWAVVDGKGPHSGMPTVAELEADGWQALGAVDPRYPQSVLMWRSDDSTASAQLDQIGIG